MGFEQRTPSESSFVEVPVDAEWEVIVGRAQREAGRPVRRLV